MTLSDSKAAMYSPTAILQSARREALFVAAVWILSCAYCVGCAALFAYRQEPNPALVLGMPAWVAWGVVLPWLVCLAATTWAALCWIRDEDLGEDQPSTVQAGPEEASRG